MSHLDGKPARSITFKGQIWSVVHSPCSPVSNEFSFSFLMGKLSGSLKKGRNSVELGGFDSCLKSSLGVEPPERATAK